MSVRRNISDVMGHESLEFPSLAQDENKFSPVGSLGNIKSVMAKISKKSIESLHHFQCVHCKKWWTIGDAPNNKDNFYCPWCGKENKFEKHYEK